MTRYYDMHKAGGILIKDRKLLVEKSYNKEFFIAPGGKLEGKESPEQALVRELKEEFGVTVFPKDLERFGTFYADAAGQESKLVRMDVFIVKKWNGEPLANCEVEDMRWITSGDADSIPVGSIFEHDVIPALKEQDLID